MTSWRRTLGNVRTFFGNATGGLRGGANVASWVVAGTLAYFLWVKPAQDLKKEQEERAALAAASDPYRYIEKRKPIPDPQVISFVLRNREELCKGNLFMHIIAVGRLVGYVEIVFPYLLSGNWLDIWEEKEGNYRIRVMVHLQCCCLLRSCCSWTKMVPIFTLLWTNIF
ncbi:hypothetical protein Cni_G21140 [Canna indica]|uniref:Uncharacterized protein n=1 Tax=Canna indica TaxID=4628 RepID=A0AAQ3QIE1_9LILI|nr:hypothetical protein Cni_G21140 [Canna indica]